MSLARKFEQKLLAGDEATVQTLESVLAVLGGPGSGWTAEGGHVPGAQGGGSKTLEKLKTKADSLSNKAESLQEHAMSSPYSDHNRAKAGEAHERAGEAHKAAAAEATRTNSPTAAYHSEKQAYHERKADKLLAGMGGRGLAAAKIPQPTVLYLSAAQNEADFTCGGCSFATPEGDCAILKPSAIDLEAGSCGLYVPGTPHEQDLMGSVPASEAGYEADGPFTCGRCAHFISPDACEGVAGEVEAEGCCNAWEKADEPKTAGGPGSGWSAEGGHVPGSQKDAHGGDLAKAGGSSFYPSLAAAKTAMQEAHQALKEKGYKRYGSTGGGKVGGSQHYIHSETGQSASIDRWHAGLLGKDAHGVQVTYGKKSDPVRP